MISERYTCIQHLISEHREELERIAHALLERESLDEQQLHQLVTAANSNAERVRESLAGTHTVTEALISS